VSVSVSVSVSVCAHTKCSDRRLHTFRPSIEIISYTGSCSPHSAMLYLCAHIFSVLIEEYTLYDPSIEIICYVDGYKGLLKGEVLLYIHV
jgi:hypothetical protein